MGHGISCLAMSQNPQERLQMLSCQTQREELSLLKDRSESLSHGIFDAFVVLLFIFLSFSLNWHLSPPNRCLIRPDPALNLPKLALKEETKELKAQNQHLTAQARCPCGSSNRSRGVYLHPDTVEKGFSYVQLSAPQSRDSLRLRRRFLPLPEKSCEFLRPQDAQFPLRKKSLANRDFFCDENG